MFPELVRRSGGYRTGMKVDIRPIIEDDFKFNRCVWATEEAQANKQKAKKLAETFYYKVTVSLTR